MTTAHAQAHLIQSTGIGQGQYMWWDSKQACDEWFLRHAKDDVAIADYSRIYGEPISRNKTNVACVHVDSPLGRVLDCDYFSYYNDDESRWFHAIITGREFVSDNSSRLHFSIDYVATYFDLIKFKACYVQRITGEEAPYQNLLPEPIAVQIVETAAGDSIDDANYNSLSSVNAEFQNTTFLMVSDMNADTGAVNQPTGETRGGYAWGGYLFESADLGAIQDKCRGVIVNQRNLITKNTSTASTVQTILHAPAIANAMGNAQSLPATITCPASGKWNKTKNYQYAKITSTAGGSLTLDPKNWGKAAIQLSASFYGGINGYCRLAIAESANSNAMAISSPVWGQISFAGTGADGRNTVPFGLDIGDIIKTAIFG